MPGSIPTGGHWREGCQLQRASHNRCGVWVPGRRHANADAASQLARDDAEMKASLRAKRSNPESRDDSGLLRRCAPRNDSGGCRHSISSSRPPSRPSVARLIALFRMRARERPGAGRTHGPPAEKNAGGRNHRYGPDHPAFPARWRYGLYVISPGIGFLAPVARALVELAHRTWHQHRDARTTRFRRAHRIVRRHDRSRCNPTRPPHPAPNARDDRETPLK